MAVSQDTIEKIKALPISSVLEREGALLKRVGREFVTHCLWHNDKNPSLTVSDDKGFVFCHVCQEHNDAIGYVQKKHGFNFREACERIASTHNFQCIFNDEDNEAIQYRRAQLQVEYEKVERVQAVFRSNLVKYPESITFLQARRINPETSRSFEIGFDSNQKRITVPIHNHTGRLVGFTARTIEEDVKPKYKNTENNSIFNKSELVFNEYRASDFIRESDECIFVEGHFDVISMWQAGIKNVVALQGTASPSDSILKRLSRKTKRFTLCMDSDTGGRLAVAKFLEATQNLALSGKIDIKIVTLPEGSDPDDFIKSGGDISSLISNAPSWLDWILDSWLNELDFNDQLKIQQVETQLKDLLSRIESQALRAHYFDKASIRLAQNKQALAAEILKAFKDNTPKQYSSRSWKKPSLVYTRKLVERRLVRLYIHRPDMRWIVEPLMENLYTPSLIWLWQRIKEVVGICDTDELSPVLMSVLAVAEPYYMQQVRPIVLPTIIMDDNELSVAHIEDVMTKDLTEEGILD